MKRLVTAVDLNSDDRRRIEEAWPEEADGKNAPTTTIGLEHYWPMNSANFTADTVGSATLAAGTGVSFSPDSPFA